MAHHAHAVDIGELPELVRLAEEVRATNEPRTLCRGSEEIATIVPLRPKPSQRRSKAVMSDSKLKAFLATAGGWADVDVDAFLEANRRSRDLSTDTRASL